MCGVEAVDVHNTQVLAMEVVLAKVSSELRLNVIFLVDVSGSFGLFVGQCVASLEVSDEFISHSFVAELREEIIFGLFL